MRFSHVSLCRPWGFLDGVFFYVCLFHEGGVWKISVAEIDGWLGNQIMSRRGGNQFVLRRPVFGMCFFFITLLCGVWVKSVYFEKRVVLGDFFTFQ